MTSTEVGVGQRHGGVGVVRLEVPGVVLQREVLGQLETRCRAHRSFSTWLSPGARWSTNDVIRPSASQRERQQAVGHRAVADSCRRPPTPRWLSCALECGPGRRRRPATRWEVGLDGHPTVGQATASPAVGGHRRASSTRCTPTTSGAGCGAHRFSQRPNRDRPNRHRPATSSAAIRAHRVGDQRIAAVQ
jgi:hypothetical protein